MRVGIGKTFCDAFPQSRVFQSRYRYSLQEKDLFLWHEPGMNGPGWDVYVHRAHGNLVKNPAPIRILARVLIVRALAVG